MTGVMLQWTVFVESVNKPVFVNLQCTVILWDLIYIEKSLNTLGKLMVFLNFLNCKLFLISINLIHSFSLRMKVAFLVEEQNNCFI